MVYIIIIVRSNININSLMQPLRPLTIVYIVHCTCRAFCPPFWQQLVKSFGCEYFATQSMLSNPSITEKTMRTTGFNWVHKNILDVRLTECLYAFVCESVVVCVCTYYVYIYVFTCGLLQCAYYSQYMEQCPGIKYSLGGSISTQLHHQRSTCCITIS